MPAGGSSPQTPPCAAGSPRSRSPRCANEPRSIYGRIVAEADRCIDPATIIRRTVQYGVAHYPALTREEHYARCLDHLQHKYGEGGYLKLWIPESDNARRLEELRATIRDTERLRRLFDTLFDEEQRRD